MFGPVCCYPKTTKPVAQRVPGAKILTSSECEAILLERESRKKLRRRREKWKESERRREKKYRNRQPNREQKKQNRELNWQRRKQRHLRTKRRCAPNTIAPSTTKKTKVAQGDPATAGEPSTSLTSPESPASSSKPSRQRKADHEGGDSFDENQCSVCFRTYEEDVLVDTGLDWLQCACRLHEECID